MRKAKIIAKQLNKVLSQQNSIDVYLECKDCAAIPLWAEKQKSFDHYQQKTNSQKMSRKTIEVDSDAYIAKLKEIKQYCLDHIDRITAGGKSRSRSN